MKKETSERPAQEEDTLYKLYTPSEQTPVYIDVKVDGKPVSFQLDTGASVSVMSITDYCNRSTFGNDTLALRAYSGNAIPVVGGKIVPAEVECEVPLVVVEGDGPPLFGGTWLHKQTLPWEKIFMVNQLQATTTYTTDIKDVLHDFDKLFTTNDGLLKNFKAHLEVTEDAKPIFCKARPLPFSMRCRVEQELQQLHTDGIIEPVRAHSDWATPVVPVTKYSGKIRLCGNYKLTVNRNLRLEHYPLPLVDELVSNIAGGQNFTKLGLSSAYHQLELDEDSTKLTTLNTHCDPYQYKRLPFGISSAVAIFQKAIETIMK